MSATDMQPTRMEAAKAAARDFVERQPFNVQVGIVAFSDGGISVLPPTKDQEAILTAIDRLSPQRGTSLGSGILASLNAIAQSRNEIPVTGNSLTPVPTPTPVPYGTFIPAAIVLITDGENTANPDPIEAALVAAQQGVRVYTIGVGSAAGTTLTVNDFTVFTQLDEPMLQQIASLTDGEYYNAENEEDLREVYENLDVQVVIKPEKTEVTSIFTGISILLMLLGGVFSLVWFSRLP
jgi:Ca-activated chloride channel family protein